ncbi:dephospho-CoA kinase [Blattabacterium cuenoti]|uniref:dephospho-CoA kinase n=1 Tax=Blattabacterium cuenoti TaxID=1653831 RepID=UPI00163CD8EF|nr:dephospho-CoA kinase [Blattabacterium cuenoti]
MKSLLIGITGNIGSGKTLYSSFMKKYNIPIYYSDKRGKIIMNKSNLLKSNIIKYFGKNSYTKMGIINSSYLSKIVFQNSYALKLLCKLIYPLIKIDFELWKKSLLINNFPPYLIKESATLFESGSYKNCDIIIVLNSSLENKIKRIIKRDNLNELQIINRLNNQLKINDIKVNSNNIIIIDNNLSIDQLKKKSHKIHKTIIKKINYGKRR